MGRRSHEDVHKRVNLYLDEKLMTELQLFYFDPARGKARYGVLSEIVNTALRAHLNGIKRQQRDREKVK